jgi:hypothetical protein
LVHGLDVAVHLDKKIVMSHHLNISPVLSK